MKRLFITLLATSFLATPAAFSAPAGTYEVSQIRSSERHDARSERTVIKKKTVVRKNRWARGHRLSPAERRRVANVNDYRRYRLNAPPRGQRWVKVDNDFLLISVATGVIVGLSSAR